MSIFNKYISSQRGIFYSHISKIIKSSECNVFSEKSAVSWKIVFKDGSTLETFEVVETNNDIIEKKKYGYEYKRLSVFFLFYE